MNTTPEQAAHLHRAVAGTKSMSGASRDELMKEVLDQLIFMEDELDIHEQLSCADNLADFAVRLRDTLEQASLRGVAA